jgi:hypothetical protein
MAHSRSASRSGIPPGCGGSRGAAIRWCSSLRSSTTGYWRITLRVRQASDHPPKIGSWLPIPSPNSLLPRLCGGEGPGMRGPSTEGVRTAPVRRLLSGGIRRSAPRPRTEVAALTWPGPLIFILTAHYSRRRAPGHAFPPCPRKRTQLTASPTLRAPSSPTLLPRRAGGEGSRIKADRGRGSGHESPAANPTPGAVS